MPSAQALPDPKASTRLTGEIPENSTPVRSGDAERRALVGQTIADVERHLILDTLDHCLGNRTHAARILGISIRTLRNKLNEYTDAGIAVPEPGQKKPATA